MSQRAWAKVADLRESGDVDGLVAILNDSSIHSDDRLRAHIVRVLGMLGNQAAADAVARTLETEPNKGIRVDAAWSLANLATSDHESVLIHALHDRTDYRVRMHAARGLGELRSPQAIAALSTALQDSNKGVRWQVAHSLGKTGNAEAIPALILALGDRNMRTRVVASHALAAIGARTALPALKRARRRTLPPWRFAISRDIRYLEERVAS